MSVAVAGKTQHWAARAIRAHGGVEPDLARAALDLVGIAMRRLRQRRQFAPQLNQIAITIIPVVQDRKIAYDLVNVSHCVQARTLLARVGVYIESNAAQVDIPAAAACLDDCARLAASHRVSGVLSRRRTPPWGGKVGGGQRILRVLVRDRPVSG